MFGGLGSASTFPRRKKIQTSPKKFKESSIDTLRVTSRAPSGKVSLLLFSCLNESMNLVAQCEIPAYPAVAFRDGFAEGVSYPFCIVFMWFGASIAEMAPFVERGVAPPLRMLSKGERLRKGGGGVSHPMAMLKHQKPHNAQWGGYR